MSASRKTWVGGSFRDPDGRLFTADGTLFREVRPSYASRYRTLMESGLYDELVRHDRLVPHEEVEAPEQTDSGTLVLRPDPIPFVSYPYEWTFSALKSAALLTLDVQRIALDHEMILKDASAFNVQFRAANPVFIDTLSFDHYEEGAPWYAYRQFCRHFLAPLCVGAYAGWTVRGLWRAALDGVPLRFASRTLPLHTWLRPSLLMHLHLHGLGEQKLASVARPGDAGHGRITKKRLTALCDSLRRAIESLAYVESDSAWTDYYDSCDHYPGDDLERKDAAVRRCLDRADPETVWDLGANTGRYSLLAAERASNVVALEAEPGAVEGLWHEVRGGGASILPLVMDLTNPSPDLGWRGRERVSLAERGPADALLLLATIHHLRLAGNIPLDELAAWLAGLGRWVVVEWIPRDDEKVQELLARRRLRAPDYTEERYREAFLEHFERVSSESLAHSGRILELWRNRIEPGERR